MTSGNVCETKSYESWDSYFLKLAFLVSERGTCNRLKVGAVLTKHRHIISTGYNGAPSGWDHCTDEGCILINGRCRRCIHAEMNAICWAAKKGLNIESSKLYVTTPPCLNCFLTCVNAGVRSIIHPAGTLARDQEEMAFVTEWSHRYGIEVVGV